VLFYYVAHVTRLQITEPLVYALIILVYE